MKVIEKENSTSYIGIGNNDHIVATERKYGNGMKDINIYIGNTLYAGFQRASDCQKEYAINFVGGKR